MLLQVAGTRFYINTDCPYSVECNLSKDMQVAMILLENRALYYGIRLFWLILLPYS